MIKKIIFCLLIGFLLFSCKKERAIHISAKNAVTGTPYSGLTYYVVQKKTGANGEIFETLKEGVLNSDGEAFLTMKLKKAHAYGIRVEQPPNTCYYNELAFHFGNQESNFEAHFEYAECGYLKLRIENVNCEGPDDLMNFRHKYDYTEWEGWSSDRNGCYYFESPEFFEVSEGWRVYEWKVQRGGNNYYHNDSIYISPNQDYMFEMNY